jgi:hypothetical protein
LLAHFQADGTGQLDDTSYLLAVAVAAEIVGLTNSDQAGMAKRIDATLAGIRLRGRCRVSSSGLRTVAGYD